MRMSPSEVRTVRRRGRLLLTWRNGDIDISPTYLYGHSYEYAAPGKLVSA